MRKLGLNGLSLLADCGIGGVVILPNGNNEQGEEHGVEDANDREFEARHLVVEFSAKRGWWTESYRG
jgi:hypothetical protein